jgi:hypothetical protein
MVPSQIVDNIGPDRRTPSPPTFTAHIAVIV